MANASFEGKKASEDDIQWAEDDQYVDEYFDIASLVTEDAKELE